jgi:hypothetical protein
MQKARQNAMITQDWAIKQANLTREIQLDEFELQRYTDKARAIPELTKLMVQQENEFSRVMAEFTEEQRQLRADESVSHSAQESAMRALSKDLESFRSESVARERRTTAKSITNSKAGADRLLQKLTAKNHAAIAALGRASRKKNGDGERSHFARAMDLIAEAHTAAQTKFQFLFETQIQELHENLRAFSQAGMLKTDDQLRLITLNHQKIISLLTMQGDRYREQMAVRKLEITAVNAQMLVLDGVVCDYRDHLDELRERRSEFVHELLRQHPELIDEHERADIECHRLYVQKAKSIIGHCVALFDSYLNERAPIPLGSDVHIGQRSMECIHPSLNLQLPIRKEEHEVDEVLVSNRESERLMKIDAVAIPSLSILPVVAEAEIVEVFSHVGENVAIVETVEEASGESEPMLNKMPLSEPAAIAEKMAMTKPEPILEGAAVVPEILQSPTVSRRDEIQEQPGFGERMSENQAIPNPERIGELPAILESKEIPKEPLLEEAEQIAEPPFIADSEQITEGRLLTEAEQFVEASLVVESERSPEESVLLEAERITEEPLVAMPELVLSPTLSYSESQQETVSERQIVQEDTPVRRMSSRTRQRPIVKARPSLREARSTSVRPSHLDREVIRKDRPNPTQSRHAAQHQTATAPSILRTHRPPDSRRNVKPAPVAASSVTGDMPQTVSSCEADPSPRSRDIAMAIIPLSSGRSEPQTYFFEDINDGSTHGVGRGRPGIDSQTWMHQRLSRLPPAVHDRAARTEKSGQPARDLPTPRRMAQRDSGRRRPRNSPFDGLAQSLQEILNSSAASRRALNLLDK